MTEYCSVKCAHQCAGSSCTLLSTEWVRVRDPEHEMENKQAILDANMGQDVCPGNKLGILRWARCAGSSTRLSASSIAVHHALNIVGPTWLVLN